MATIIESQRVAAQIMEHIGQMTRRELGVRMARALDEDLGGVELHLAEGALVRVLLAEDGRYDVCVSRRDARISSNSVGAEGLRGTALRLVEALS
jgi:hypothetical protein